MSKVKLIVFLLCVLGNIAAGQMTPKKLIKQYKKATKEYLASDDMSGLTFTTEGQMHAGEIAIPVKIYVVETAMRMELEIMGAVYYGVNTDTLSWSYNPLDQKYEFTTEDEPAMDANFQVDADTKFLELLNQGYQPEAVTTIKLDSIEVYDLRVAFEGDIRNFYFDTKSFYLRGAKSDSEEEYYFDYVVFQNRLWPTRYIIKGEQDLSVRFDGYTLADRIDPSIFEMNQVDRKAYNDYLNEKNAPEVSEVQELYDQGMALNNEGKYEEAIEVFNKGLQSSPDDPVILNGRGLAKSSLQDYYGAIADYERALEGRPDYAVAINNRGLAKYNLSDFDGALKDYEQALALDSTNSSFLSNTGLVYMQKSDFNQMASYFDKAINYNPSSANYFYYRGMARAQIEQYEDALSDYVKAEEMGVVSPYLSNYKGVTEYNLGNFEAALKDFMQAHELDGTNEQYLRNAADSQRELEQYEASIDTYSKIIALDTTNAYGYASRAISEYDLDQLEPALQDINKAIALYNENALYFDYRAYIKSDMGDFKGAIEDFTQSLSMEEDSNIYYKRGLAKIEIKDDPGACEDFQKAADMDDNNGKEALIKYCKL
ncbi:MAG: hypothetical protein Roseis2KO_34640 [Roseivirga sp.]